MAANSLAGKSLSLDQFIAMNTELSLLARSGLPLEKGLREFGSELPGRLGELATQIEKRLAAGEDLAKTLSDPAFGFPPIYRVVIEAGLRSGRLAVALEGIATVAARSAHLRKQLLAALAYPLFVLLIAYYMTLFVITRIMPSFPLYYRAGHEAVPESLRGTDYLTNLSLGWAVWLPPVLLVVGAIVWFLQGKARQLGSRALRWWDRFPTPAAVHHHGSSALFAELLALLIEQQVPLPQALELASEIAGNGPLHRAAASAAEQLRRGERPTTGLPPVIQWTITTNSSDSVVRTLRNLARMNRVRAEQIAHWLVVYFPMIVTAVVGGIVVLMYCFLVMWPFTRLLYELESV